MLNWLVDYLRSKYACHTVILYGSRARGDFTPASDYDALGIRADGESIRDAFVHDGAYMDLFVYPESALAATETFLHLLGGRILCQQGDCGTRFLAAVAVRYEAGPSPLAPDEAAARRVWWRKMVGRAETGDVEGNYRRVWLLTQLLEDYFVMRGRWYRGPKESFAWLKQHEPDMYAAFDRALQPGAALADIEAVVSLAVSRT